MRSSIRSLVVVTLVAAIVMGIGVASAAADPLVIPPYATSTSNPTNWQGGWGNTLYPDYSIAVPGGATGIYYIVDRDPATVMYPALTDQYFHSLLSGGTMFTSIVDIDGTYRYAPSGYPGATDAREGVWYMHILPYTYAGGVQTFGLTTLHVPIGIDITGPRTPTGVRVSPDPSVPPATSAVTRSVRATVYWDGLDYDALSGTVFYSIYVNGYKTVSGAVDALMSVPESIPPVWYVPTWTSGHFFTIEDMPVGRNVIQVTATDRAGNESPMSSAAVIFNGPDLRMPSPYAPRITSVYDTPDPFYPRKRDGYKDDSIVRFRLSKRAMVWLLVYNSAGSRVRLVTSGWKNRGRRYLKWNGTFDDGKTIAPDGTYTIYVGADDGRGHVSFSNPRTTRLRSFIVKRLGHNRVRLIFK